MQYIILGVCCYKWRIWEAAALANILGGLFFHVTDSDKTHKRLSGLGFEARNYADDLVYKLDDRMP